MTRYRVALIDDHEIVARGFAELFSTIPEVHIVATVTTELVSRPYVELTRRVMSGFGVGGDDLLTVEPGGYQAAEYRVEPDATAASYFADHAFRTSSLPWR